MVGRLNSPCTNRTRQQILPVGDQFPCVGRTPLLGLVRVKAEREDWVQLVRVCGACGFVRFDPETGTELRVAGADEHILYTFDVFVGDKRVDTFQARYSREASRHREMTRKGLLQRFGCRPMPTSMERWVNFGMQVGDSHICGYHVDNNAWS